MPDLPKPDVPPGRKIAYQLDADDVVSATRSHARSSNFFAALAMGAIVAVGFVIVLMESRDWRPLLVAGIASFIGVAAVYAAIHWLYIPWRARKMYAEYAALRQPIELTWDDHAVVMAATSSWSRIAWSDLRRWAQDHRVYRLYPNKMMFHIVPKRAFPSAADEAAFRACLTSIGAPR